MRTDRAKSRQLTGVIAICRDFFLPASVPNVMIDLETGIPLGLAKKVLAAVDEDDVDVLNHLSAHDAAQVSQAMNVMAHDPSRYVSIPRFSPTDDLNTVRDLSK